MGTSFNTPSVGIATGYELDGWDSIPGKGKTFFSSTVSRPVLRLLLSNWDFGLFPLE
jgi:hypothetical protein